MSRPWLRCWGAQRCLDFGCCASASVPRVSVPRVPGRERGRGRGWCGHAAGAAGPARTCTQWMYSQRYQYYLVLLRRPAWAWMSVSVSVSPPSQRAPCPRKLAGWLASDGDLRCNLASGFGTFCCEQGQVPCLSTPAASTFIRLGTGGYNPGARGRVGGKGRVQRRPCLVRLGSSSSFTVVVVGVGPGPGPRQPKGGRRRSGGGRVSYRQGVLLGGEHTADEMELESRAKRCCYGSAATKSAGKGVDHTSPSSKGPGGSPLICLRCTETPFDAVSS